MKNASFTLLSYNMETISRNTKYTAAVLNIIQKHGHTTNTEILTKLSDGYPHISATTIHRITTRLSERGEIGLAPSSNDGSMRYDANTQPHDHFICAGCGGIRDIDIAVAVTPLISTALVGCKITGRLVIHGSCEKCLHGGQI